MRRLQYLAKANVAGSAFSLMISVPIYYMLGLKGIVPAIIISAFITLLSSWFFGSKINIEKIKFDKAALFMEGGDMVKMGFFLSLNSFVSMGTSYVVRIFLSHYGGVEQVGLYNAGFALINTNIGMVFSAMATDYFPRLSGVAHDPRLAKSTINQQAEIALLILAPVLTVFIIFVNWFVILFYSSRFAPIENMIHWAAMGIFFQATSWCIAYLLVAKGDTRLFFFNEVSANTYILGLNILGYMWKGLEGLGIAFFTGYLLYTIQVSILAFKKYGFSYDKEFFRIFGIQFLIAILCFISSRILGSPKQFIPGSIFIILSCYYSIRELNKRLSFVSLIMNKFKKSNSGK
jgi:O-antigen/teichoic acid export membrane protein